jgi:hypothetical protein
MPRIGKKKSPRVAFYKGVNLCSDLVKFDDILNSKYNYYQNMSFKRINVHYNKVLYTNVLMVMVKVMSRS